MSVFRDIELTWKGENYKVRPSMSLIFELEAIHGCSLMGFANRARENDIPVSIAYEYVAKTLKHAGVKDITSAQIFDDVGGVRVEVLTMAMVIVSACLNIEDDSKKKTNITSTGNDSTP
jgi:hypothetical protein